MVEYWTTVGIVAMMAAFLGATVSLIGVWRNIKHKVVMEERQNWRSSIREIIPAFIAEKDVRERERMRNAIILRLNPYDDQIAIDLLMECATSPSPDAELKLVTHFQAMLKYEWERAKRETSLISWGAGWRAALSLRRQSRRSHKFCETDGK